MSEQTTIADLEQQIVEAMAEGDFTKSFQLKSERQNRINRGATQGQVPTEGGYIGSEQHQEDVGDGKPAAVAQAEQEDGATLVQQIMDAQAEGDWTKSFNLKSQLTDQRNRAGARERANGGWANR